MSAAFISQLQAIVGEPYVLTQSADTTPYCTEWRGRWVGQCLAVAKPANTAQVAEVVKLCGQHGINIVPQGGNTGAVGGSIPYGQPNSLVLNLSRLNNIRAVDAANFTITVEAGCILQHVQEAALNANRFFALSLGSEGTCQIGGNIASNAGGIQTIAFGNCRDQVLGLEVVLPNGDIWHGLRTLRKDNTGYDLKHLFIGSEGTLGIITAATLKLQPSVGSRVTAFLALPDLPQAIELLALCRQGLDDKLLAFELISAACVDLAVAQVPSVVRPLESSAPWFVLLEMKVGNNAEAACQAQMLGVIEQAMSQGLVIDGTLAQSTQQAKDLWLLREAVVEAQKRAGGSIKHDISVPVSAIPAFVAQALALVQQLVQGVRPMVFGHVGDGNLHFNLTQPEGMDKQVFVDMWDDVNHQVHDLVMQFGGSFAAEHGVGAFKRAEMHRLKSPVELALMQTLKTALDPAGIMNADKVL